MKKSLSSSLSDQSLLSKQNYLHKQIIEQDFDPQQFQQYMSNQKGLNLQDYTMKQLNKIVRQFKGSYIETNSIIEEKEKEKENIDIDRIIQKNIGLDININNRELGKCQDKEDKQLQEVNKDKQYNNNNSNNINIKQQNKSYKISQLKSQYLHKNKLQQQPLSSRINQKSISISTLKSFHQTMSKSLILAKKQTFPRIYKQLYPCSSSSSLLSKQKLSISIKYYSKKQSTSILFKFPYISYFIQTSSNLSPPSSSSTPPLLLISQSSYIKYKVQRRYNDFNFLYNYLIVTYPGLPIPPIPQKTTMRSFQDYHIKERMVMFERFLNKCINIQEICSDLVFEMFLNVQNREQFERIKNKYTQKLKQKQNNLYCFINGEQLSQSKHKSNLIITKQKQRYYDKCVYQLNLLNIQTTQLLHHLKLSSQHSQNSIKILKQLTSINKQYQIPQWELYDAMSEFVSQIKDKINNEYFYIKNYIQNVWIYEQKYKETIVDKITQLQKHKMLLKSKQKYVIISQQSNKYNKTKQGHKISQEQLQLQLQIQHPQPNYDFSNKHFSQYLRSKQLYHIQYNLLSQQLHRHQQKDLQKLSLEWAQGMKLFMDQLKQSMLIGVDMYTRAICIMEGKDIRQVDYIAKKKQKKQHIIVQVQENIINNNKENNNNSKENGQNIQLK